jgi:bifunctional UDP-N-acetylglucosamine pyrophosphorylase / glucosamine-1-phosphate N-acetyltransferase
MTKLQPLAVVLAAGKSRRFCTTMSKLITPLCGRPMIYYPLQALAENQLAINIILGHQSEIIKNEILSLGFEDLSFSMQTEQLGTGHALACSQPSWGEHDTILVINGDMPAITGETIKQFIEHHEKNHASVSIVSTHILNPHGYGRIIQSADSIKIVEEKDCTDAERAVSKINAGIYLFSTKFLESAIGKLQSNNASHEFYLTDLIGIANNQGEKVSVLDVPFEQVRGVNTLEELWVVEQDKRVGLIKMWMNKGVHFENSHNMHIDVDVSIGKNTTIGSGVILLRGTKIGEGCTINAFSILGNASVGDHTAIKSHTIIQDSIIGKKCKVGPFARIKNYSIVSDESVIENFVEIKRSEIGSESSVKQLSCLSDTKVGNHSQIHPGVICSGSTTPQTPPAKTIIADHVKVGSNSTLISPAIIDKGSILAPNSVISHENSKSSCSSCHSSLFLTPELGAQQSNQ